MRVLHFADMTRWRTLLHWVPALAWAAVIFTLSAQPGSEIPGPLAKLSVEGHFALYAILSILLWFALGGRSAGWRSVILAIVIASAYGVTDEFHQSFIPQRTPDPWDWLTDTIGAAAGAIGAYYVSGWRARRKRASESA